MRCGHGRPASSTAATTTTTITTTVLRCPAATIAGGAAGNDRECPSLCAISVHIALLPLLSKIPGEHPAFHGLKELSCAHFQDSSITFPSGEINAINRDFGALLATALRHSLNQACTTLCGYTDDMITVTGVRGGSVVASFTLTVPEVDLSRELASIASYFAARLGNLQHRSFWSLPLVVKYNCNPGRCTKAQTLMEPLSL